MCKTPFVTGYANKNICSFKCKQEHNRIHARDYARQKRLNAGKRVCLPCEICGWSETTDRHEEGGKTTILCPNHHALITRNIATLEELKWKCSTSRS